MSTTSESDSDNNDSKIIYHTRRNSMGVEPPKIPKKRKKKKKEKEKTTIKISEEIKIDSVKNNNDIITNLDIVDESISCETNDNQKSKESIVKQMIIKRVKNLLIMK